MKTRILFIFYCVFAFSQGCGDPSDDFGPLGDIESSQSLVASHEAECVGICSHSEGFDQPNLESMSAEALVDSKLLPKLRVQIIREAKKWHRGSQEKLASLPNCKHRNKPAKYPCLADDASLLAQAKVVRPCEKPVKKMKKRGGKENTLPLSAPIL
jgi:hypothetical protein